MEEDIYIATLCYTPPPPHTRAHTHTHTHTHSSLPERLVLEAKEHYVNASVMAEQKDSDLLLTVRYATEELVTD